MVKLNQINGESFINLIKLKIGYYKKFIPWITTNNEKNKVLKIKKIMFVTQRVANMIKIYPCRCYFTVVTMVQFEMIMSTIIERIGSTLKAMRISVVIAI